MPRRDEGDVAGWGPQGGRTMDYNRYFAGKLEALKSEGRYRIFADLAEA